MFDLKLLVSLWVFGAIFGSLMGYFLDFSFLGIVMSAMAYAFATGLSGPGFALIMMAAIKKISDAMDGWS